MLILKKIIKTVATRCQILKLKCTKFSASPDCCDALLLKGGKGEGGGGGGEERKERE